MFVTSTVYVANISTIIFLNQFWACHAFFFDVTPTGRILNRFAGDLDQIDGLLPRFFLMLLEKNLGNVWCYGPVLSIHSILCSVVHTFRICFCAMDELLSSNKSRFKAPGKCQSVTDNIIV